MRTKTCVLLLALCLGTAAAHGAPSLVTNGGFETGDFTGWTPAGTQTQVQSEFLHTGSYGARLREASITQAIATNPDDTYTLEFWIDNRVGKFWAFWDGIQIFNTNEGPDAYHHYVFTGLTATTASTQLAFISDSVAGIGATWIDDISVVTEVPEPATMGVVALGGALLMKRRRA